MGGGPDLGEPILRQARLALGVCVVLWEEPSCEHCGGTPYAPSLKAPDAERRQPGPGARGVRLALRRLAHEVPHLPVAEQTEIPAAEYEALVALYNATNGPYWTTTWTLDDTPCDMYGVHCEPESGEPRHVTRLDLPSNVLKGSIPPEIGALTGLNYLNLSDNQLTGGLPAEMANLVALEDLNVDQNLLSGNLPAWLGTLTNLTRPRPVHQPLDRGTIPSEIFQLTNLTELFLDSCELTGPIPSAIGNLTALEELDLSGNALDGGIPEQPGQRHEPGQPAPG